MAIQLNLFGTNSLVEPFEVLSENEFQEMAVRQGIAEEVTQIGECRKCRYRDMCDSDGCGVHYFSYYSKNPLKGTYDEWCNK